MIRPGPAQSFVAVYMSNVVRPSHAAGSKCPRCWSSYIIFSPAILAVIHDSPLMTLWSANADPCQSIGEQE